MTSLLSRYWRLVAIVCLAGAFVFAIALKQMSRKPAPTDRMAQLQARLAAKLDEKLKKQKNGLARYDQPAEAMAYYVNRRTGGIETRGPNRTTGIRALDTQLYVAAIQQARQMPQYSTASRSILPPGAPAAPGGLLDTWSALGPNNQGGRTRQILIDPTNANVMYAAAVGGGVWKTTNGGASWTPLTDLQLPGIAVSSLVFQPGNPQVIYAGTGEGFYNGDAIRGVGVFKTTDGGTTWAQLASTANNSNFHHVNDIVVSPRNTQRIFAATRTGLFRSIDGGATWTQLVNASGVNGCTDLALQMNRALAFVFGACGNFAQGTIYRAVDANTGSFSSVSSVAGQARVSLAIAPSNESIIYAMAAAITGGRGADSMFRIIRSTANGNSGSWTTQRDNSATTSVNTVQLTNPVFALLADCGYGASNVNYNQGWYDNVIAVDPADPNRVWTGGIDLMRSDDGGVNWGVASYWWFNKTDPEYAHADQHAIVFHPGYNGSTNRIMFVGNDGGIFRTNDARANVGSALGNICGTPVAGAVNWTNLNTGYQTMQFYHGATYPDGETYFGGTQDNGTNLGATGSLNWAEILGGDGGYTAVDTLGDANAANDVQFAEFTGLSIQKRTGAGAFADAITGIAESGGNFLFISPFEMNFGNRQHLWTGGFFIWRTTNQATSWVQASALTAGNGSVSAIAASPTDTNRVIVGMSDGYIHYNTAALSATSATSWLNTRPTTSFISSLEFDPTNANIAYATVETFGTNVFRSTDGGATWTAIVGAGATAIPAVPAHTVTVDPANPTRIYVGTDIGVFTSIDSGVNWYKEVTGFANVAVEHLEVNSTGTRRLFGFTHGRGAWRVNLVP